MNSFEGLRLLIPRWKEGCLLRKRVKFEIERGEEKNILYLKPCSSRGELMAEIDLGEKGARPLDPHTLCYLLEMTGPWFSEVRCSRSLGVARFKWGIAEVNLFKDGKVKLRRLLDKKELVYLSGRLTRLLWGAMMCGSCGSPVLRCASGKCRCAEGGTRIVTVDSPLLLKGFSCLERAGGTGKTEKGGLLSEAERLALLFTMETGGGEEAPLGLFLLAKASELRSTSDTSAQRAGS